MTKKIIIAILAITVMCISLVFPKDKLSENANTLNYSYTDWKEFYTDLVEASKKDLYQYAYLRNVMNENEATNILKLTKNNTWNLISHKEMQGRDMIQSFYVVSPNGHITVLVFANNTVESYKYAIANKSVSESVKMVSYSEFSSSVSSTSKSETKKTPVKDNTKKNDDVYKEFFEKITTAFDEQLCFFDEEIPLQLSNFIKK